MARDALSVTVTGYVDPKSIDELFERSADMRLLERRHSDLDMHAPELITSSSGADFSAESIVASPEFAAFERRAQLRVHINALPNQGVFPGVLVSVAVDVSNDGGMDAPESTLFVSLPRDCELHAGSVRLDGAELAEPERIYGVGVALSALPAHSATKLTFQVRVNVGAGPLLIQPRLVAENVPIVADAGVVIARGSLSSVAAPDQPPIRPYYELEPDEFYEADLTDDEIPIVPELLLPTPPPNVESETGAAPASAQTAATEPKPKRQRRSSAKSSAQSTAQPRRPATPPSTSDSSATEVASVPPAEHVTQPAPTLPASRYRLVKAKDVALLARLLGSPTPGAVEHLVAIATIACTQGADGSDVGGFDLTTRRTLEWLGRALVLQRVGKAPGTLLTQAILDALTPGASVPSGTAPQPAAGLLLRRTYREADNAAVRALFRPSDREPTLRFHLALLAFAGEAVEATEPTLARDLATALLSYRANAMAWLGQATIASAGASGIHAPPPPPQLNAAGLRLVTALVSALG